MLKSIALGLVALMSAGGAQAHEIWMERDGTGPVRVYLGEPDYPKPPGADPEFPKLVAPLVFTDSPAVPASLTRMADHLQAAVSGAGDVRLADANVFPPDKAADGTYSARAYYARAGRTDAAAKLDFEIVPLTAGGDQFQILFKGKPASREGVRIINPDGWVKNIKSDQDARFTVPTAWQGRYILYVDHVEPGPATVNGLAVSRVTHITTLTFVKP